MRFMAIMLFSITCAFGDTYQKPVIKPLETMQEVEEQLDVLSQIINGNIDGANIRDGSLTVNDLAANSISGSKIADDSVDADAIATDAVTTVEILDGTIAAIDIGTGAVTTTEILDDTIASVDLADDAVTTTKIADLTQLVSDNIRMPSPTVPNTPISSGTAGDLAWDTDYIYVCIANNTWERVAIATWSVTADNLQWNSGVDELKWNAGTDDLKWQGT